MYEVFGSKVRQKIYVVLAVLGIVLGAIQVAMVTAGEPPKWLSIALAVFVFLGGSTHAMSAGNITPPLAEVIDTAGNVIPPDQLPQERLVAAPAVTMPTQAFDAAESASRFASEPPLPPGAVQVPPTK